MRYGIIEWALYNRLIGMTVVAAYLMCGAMAPLAVGKRGLLTFARIYIVACCALIAIEHFGRMFAGHTLLQALGWQVGRYSGMAANPNAYSLQLLLALGLATSGIECWPGRLGKTFLTFGIGLLIFGIWFCGSRAGLVAGMFVLLFSLWTGRVNIGRILLGASMAVVLLPISTELIRILPHSSWTLMAAEGRDAAFGFSLTSNVVPEMVGQISPDRWESMIGGWNLWREFPLFGAGLGAYFGQHLKATGIPLVIHSTYLWVMAEMGIVGLICFAAPPVVALRGLLRDPGWKAKWTSIATVNALLAMGVMSLAHEMAYQRAFWLVAGVLVAAPAALRRPGRHDPRAAAPAVVEHRPRREVPVPLETN
jgi:hypothetical protein